MFLLEFQAIEDGIPWPIKKYEKFTSTTAMLKRLGELVGAGYVVTVHPLPEQ